MSILQGVRAMDVQMDATEQKRASGWRDIRLRFWNKLKLFWEVFVGLSSLPSDVSACGLYRKDDVEHIERLQWLLAATPWKIWWAYLPMSRMRRRWMHALLALEEDKQVAQFSVPQLRALLASDPQLLQSISYRFFVCMTPEQQQMTIERSARHLTALRNIRFRGDYHYSSQLLLEAFREGVKASPEVEAMLKRRMRLPWCRGRALLALLYVGEVEGAEIEKAYPELVRAAAFSYQGSERMHEELLGPRDDLSSDFLRWLLKERPYRQERLLAFGRHPDAVQDGKVRLIIVHRLDKPGGYRMGMGLFRDATRGELSALLKLYMKGAPGELVEVLRDERLRPRRIEREHVLMLLQAESAEVRLSALPLATLVREKGGLQAVAVTEEVMVPLSG